MIQNTLVDEYNENELTSHITKLQYISTISDYFNFNIYIFFIIMMSTL